MTKQEVEILILGMDENETVAWETAQKKWTGGTLIMPINEMERRQAYKGILKEIFLVAGISENSFPEDSWLCGKIRRIIK